MNTKLISLLLIVFLAVSLMSACQSTPTAPAVPTAVQPSPIPPTKEPAAAEDTTSTSVLEACDVAEQSLAMRAGQMPVFETLGIDTCYDLTFELAEDGSAYQGAARITYTNQEEAPLEEFVLRTYPNAEALFGGRLTVDSAVLDGQALSMTPMLTDGSALRLALDTPLAAGQTAVLGLTFSGEVPEFSTDGFLYGTYTLSSQYPLVVLANSYPALAPRLNGDWQAQEILPQGDPPINETALYRVEIVLPQNWKVSATGVEIESSQKNGQAVTRFASGPVREFHWAASPAWTLQTLESDGVRINQWGFSDTSPAWDEALTVARDSLATYDEFFGPYPFNELDILAVPLYLASGVEYPGVILIKDSLYFSEEQPRMLPTVIAHEVAHQWWFSVIGSDVLAEPWQDEALTTYSALLYMWEHNRPFYYGTVSAYEERIKLIEDDLGWQAVGQPVSAFVGATSVAYSPIVYRKGALFFEALREELGDETFYQALQAYYQSNRYQLVPPEVLLGAFEQACQCQLDDLFADWGVP